MASIECQYTGCSYKAENASEQIALAMFNSHILTHSQPARAPTQSQKLPPIPRPEIKQDVDEEDWESFVAEWENFKICGAIPQEQLTVQLLSCCDKNLSRLIIREQPNIVSGEEAALLAAMKRIAVIKVATCVRRTNLLQSKQASGETIREFYANIKAVASICNYRVKCPHDCCATKPLVNYTSDVVKDVLVAGIADPDLRKEVLSWSELDTKEVKAVVSFVETKEVALNAWTGTSGTAALSSYKKSAKPASATDTVDQSLKSKLALRGKCEQCNEEISLFKKYQSGKVNKKAFKMCIKCHKAENALLKSTVTSMSHAPSQPLPPPNTASVDSFFVGGINSSNVMGSAFNSNCQPLIEDVPAAPALQKSMENCLSANTITLEHHIFTDEGWQHVSAPSHPTLRLRMTTHSDDYKRFGANQPKIQPKFVDVITDSGAQSALWGRRRFLRSGFCMKDLIPVRHTMKAANTAPIKIDGAILLRLSGSDDEGSVHEAAVMVYISPDTDSFFLSKESMIQLGIISSDFPKVGAMLSSETSVVASNADQAASTESTYAECGCLKRQAPPEMPTSLPFPCTIENVEPMKEWLLRYYASSAFNKCEHQRLLEMEGPPIKVHINKDAKPVTFFKPVPIPIHWQEQVEQDLERDLRLGVLERVPMGEPTKWCFKMLVTRKTDGSPRRVIDLSPMNKYCMREVHSSKSPFTLARSVPGNSVKTVLDAWNGFHSVPIQEEDRHLFTFATPIGLLRYKRAPQGFLSSGDGYNRRFDEITAHLQRIERCVDDSLLHDPKTCLEDHWWRTIEFIDLCARTGIVLNLEKFQFSQPVVDFAGFRITEDTVEPLPKYIDAIKGFPTPKNIKDIRSWFGLVNQVAHYAQLRDMMAPFREFLSPKVKFVWSPQLDSIFEESKVRIIEAIREGVKIFDPKRRTCLRTDWSKKGIGYLLAQKHCNCQTNRSYGCCKDGWKITLAGSRFLSPAEKNYAPVEGEAVAVAWALKQTEWFTMACDDLVVIVDHKPLTKIFGDRRLDEIDNDRLFRLKRRTLKWRFEIEYQRGTTNPFADAMSRYPNEHAELASIAMMSEEDTEEAEYMMCVLSDMNTFFAVTCEKVRAETERDAVLHRLSSYIKNGFPGSRNELSEEIRSFWDIRDSLRCSDGIVLYKDRIVMPASLRSRILDNLHSAHQGVSSMLSRAQSIVFWPGLAADLEEKRSACRSCNRIAPSQPKLPPTAPELPTTPFQMIFADYFQLKRKAFLVIGDRLSGWPEVVGLKDDLAATGAKGLCEALRKVFACFGVPEELSSDGGPEFIAQETADFLNRWGVKHRVSSAYFPQSNGRAEVAVKMTKRLLMDNIGENGSLNNDATVRALLQLRNTPDRDCKLSSAEVLFGRSLRDSMPQLDKTVSIHDSDQIHNQWHQAWAAKEDAIRSRLVRSCEQLEKGSKDLPPLREGDQVFLQNQHSRPGHANKWDRQGTIIAVKNNDQYLVKVNGSGRLTVRNRRFLRKFQLRSEYVPLSNARMRGADMNDAIGDSMSDNMPGDTIPADASDAVAGDGVAGDDLTGDSAVRDVMVGEAAEPIALAGDDTPDNAAPVDNMASGAMARHSNGVHTDLSQNSGARDHDAQPVTRRPPGRPPKRRVFNFMKPSTVQEQPSFVQEQPSFDPPQPTDVFLHARGSPAAEPLQQPEVRASPRARKQRQVYDAQTGKFVNPRF